MAEQPEGARLPAWPTDILRLGCGVCVYHWGMCVCVGVSREATGAALQAGTDSSRSPAQMTLASSRCPQLCPASPPCTHCPRWLSLPTHCRLSSAIFPEPAPKWAPVGAATAWPHSSWRHTTAASARSQRSSHTVPHVSWTRTSTRPEHLPGPPTSLTATQAPGRNTEERHLGSALPSLEGSLYPLSFPGGHIPILKSGKLMQSSATQIARRARTVFNFKSPQEDFILPFSKR